MDKKPYTAPKLVELGDLAKITQYGIKGQNFDGAFPEDTPDIFLES